MHARTVSNALILATALVVAAQIDIASQTTATTFKAADPGVRSGDSGVGAALAGLTPGQTEYFTFGRDDFSESEDVAAGLGPRMNLDSCIGCHSQPAAGGSAPAVNPQVAFAALNGGLDVVPSFITANGPVREARFVRNADGTADGGVHALFTISGRGIATGCSLKQPDFETQLANHNVVFRIPTPTFGAGLIEAIPDSAIIANRAANASAKSTLGIKGRANFAVAGRTISGQTNSNGNDGTIARFGWKAQNKSLLLFAGEAYNVEMGITNELFQTERDETSVCQYANVPNSVISDTAANAVSALSSIEKFALFMRLLAPPAPSATVPGGSDSIERGRALFTSVGCALCHTPSFTTGSSPIDALRYKNAPLYSDLLTHDMGIGLADGVTQGQAGPREFRTAPLWGLGQRIFFLHDGRASNLLTAIRAHASTGSEANGVIAAAGNLSEAQKQDLLNFLRSL